MNHSLYSPVDPQRTLEHQTAVHLTRFHFQAFGVVKRVVSCETFLEFYAGNGWAGRGFRRRLILKAEAFVRLNASAMAKKLRSEEGAVTRNMTVRHLERNRTIISLPERVELIETNALMLRVLSRVKTLATFMASETFRVPVKAQRLLALS